MIKGFCAIVYNYQHNGSPKSYLWVNLLVKNIDLDINIEHIMYIFRSRSFALILDLFFVLGR